MRPLLASTFRNPYSIQSSTALNDEQLFKVVPSVFAAEKHESRSDKYLYIPTIDILHGLKKEGFEPFFACQCRTRTPGRHNHTKHMLRLRHASQEIDKSSDTNEIILLNSHDGTSSYQMMAGRFRFVCSNGMIRGDITSDIRTPHKGNVLHNIIEGAYTILDNFSEIDETVDGFKSISLNSDEKRAYARAALELKYDDGKAPIEADDLLRTRRFEDRGDNSIWNTFNVVQENVIRGGLHGKTRAGKNTTTREVGGIDGNVKLNRALWVLADELKRLKA